MTEARIMIVEDNALVAESCRDILERLGYQVAAIVATGEEAVTEAARLQPQAVLMDIRLAGEMDGIDAADKIYREYTIPVVFLSAYSDRALLKRARAVGSFGYLVKPYKEDDLATMLEMTLYKAGVEKARQEAREQIQRLEKNQSLARMAGAVAHNYNNLLAVVMGNLDLAMEELPADSKISAYLTGALNGTRRAAKLGEQILACLGEAYRERTCIPVAKTCAAHLQALMERRQDEMNTRLKLEFPENDVVIQAHEEDLRQVIDALLANAQEAISSEPGTITIRVRSVEWDEIKALSRQPVDFEPGPHRCFVGVEIEDTGCGIPAAEYERIFEPFFTTKFTGRGLGLSVALGLIRALGGFMTVTSKPGEGSTFGAWLPVANPEMENE